MKIDTHQHFWSYQLQDFAWIDASMPVLQQDRSPAHVRACMQTAGVDACMAVQARCVSEETDYLLSLASQDPGLIGVVGWMDFNHPQMREQVAAWAQHPKLCGFRHILQDEPSVSAWVNQAAVAQGLRLLQQQQLSYDVLVFAHQLSEVQDFCQQHDQHWLVLDHVAKPNLKTPDAAQDAAWFAQLKHMARLPHVMCKLSGLVTETNWQRGLHDADVSAIHQRFDQALSVFGAQRLMYGSDWPVCELAASYARVHGIAQDWANTRLSSDEQAAFWSGNAMRCYGLTG